MKNQNIQLMNDDIAIINSKLQSVLNFKSSYYDNLYDSIKYSVFSSGKRIRPVLCIEICRMLSSCVEQALIPACAIELVHTYSLIHDDLPCMDNDDYRRGKLTNHKVFGENTAVLAGDGLLTYAFQLLANNDLIDDSCSLETIKILSYYAGINGMVGGQQIDINSENKEIDFDTLITMDSLKTGALFKASCLMGCVCGGFSSNTKEYESIKQFAENIGIAFQICDDILDYKTEKSKNTFTSFLGLKESEKSAEKYTNKGIDAIKHFKNNDFLIDLANELTLRKM